MVVLRESFGGASKQDEMLKPLGKLRTRLPDGREVEVELASFAFLGDMHIRFVFDATGFMSNATPQDLARLQVTPAEALDLAIRNIKRVYGDPVAKPLMAGIMQVEGKSPDLNSSYFLDRGFWQNLLLQYPDGILVGVPKRGGLVFAAMSDRQGVGALQRGIASLYASSQQMRVSSALYLFKDDHWSVFQPPQAQ